ncbi:CLUMA_CG018422, isoform A [Clunio marinus]|uniref:CLUMA_CG018422, isoform A n=1 Tax=Clunio marinus TaxID=568069 RepID=A0A1J1J353_9DIPT|nr:CLUMA_CG018422, isoform A [Clunio marinus]
MNTFDIEVYNGKLSRGIDGINGRVVVSRGRNLKNRFRSRQKRDKKSIEESSTMTLIKKEKKGKSLIVVRNK